MLCENYDHVRERIDAAALRAGRDPKEVTLIAVSKTKPLSDIETLITHGVRCFGENKVQELCDKYAQVSEPCAWHLIGHLQTNKVKYIVDKVALIHSVDSLHLAEEIEKEAAKRNVCPEILIEVNVAGEESKFGISPEELPRLVTDISGLPHVKVRGLMTIAPFVEDPEENRGYFRKMRELSLDIKSKNIDNSDMSILSMGMTGDYQVAVEEGATMVRVGTAIFGERNYTI